MKITRAHSAGSCQARAQSESIGVIMLTAIIVLLVGGFGVVYLDAGDDTTDGPLIDAKIETTADHVSVTHVSGESTAIDDVDVLVRNDDARDRYTFDASNITNDEGDARFDPSERFRRNHDVGSGQLEVLLIHTPSNTVLEQVYLDT